MTSKEFVLSKMPNARSERHKTNAREVYWLIRNGNLFMPFAYGETEAKAWKKAKDILSKQ